ncbi:MAG: tripartite tricarboxylate transporter substrate binding protein [Pirellulaceae bacterium]
MSRTAACFLVAGWLIVPGCKPSAEDAAYPRKSVTIVCPWSPGGGTDRVSRFWADALQRELGKPFIVTNKTGGSGAVGHSAGALARPDGYTITTITFELCTMHRMGISPLTYRDFQCLLQMNADAAAIIVRADAPWRSLTEFLQEVRESPGTIKMSGTATGGAWDLARAGLLQAAELPASSIVWVPQEGAAPSLTELLGGHLDAVCCSVPEAAAQIQGDSPQLRVLAVMAEERLEDYPECPTAKESGTEWVALGWRGLALPKNTSADIVALLETKCRAIAASEAYRTFMQKNGFHIEIRGPEEFSQFLAQQDEQWKSVIEAAGYAQN